MTMQNRISLDAKKTTRKVKINHEIRRLAVGQALLNLDDPYWLEDSPLAELLPAVSDRCLDRTKLFIRGITLSEYLREVVQTVIIRLEGNGKIGILRDALQGVVAGKSIAQVAREHRLTREHFSRHYWSLAVRLVTEEIVSLNKEQSC